MQLFPLTNKQKENGKNATSAHPSLKHAVVVDTDVNVFDPQVLNMQ